MSSIHDRLRASESLLSFARREAHTATWLLAENQLQAGPVDNHHSAADLLPLGEPPMGKRCGNGRPATA